MLGAIVGDIIGSVYEWSNIKTKNFPLFGNDNFFTDDTVMTIAVADAVMNGGTEENFIDSMKKYGGMYHDAGYGVVDEVYAVCLRDLLFGVGDWHGSSPPN